MWVADIPRWRAWLHAALSRLKRSTASDSADPAQRLRALRGSDLIALDSRLRSEAAFDKAPEGPAVASGSAKDDDDSDAYLFVASCHPDGHIRERALIAFREHAGPLALAAGLIHSTDWVREVRSAAISLVDDVVPRLPAADVVRYLDLAVSLKGRLRVSETVWQKGIRPRLTARESRNALWAAARNLKNSRVLRHSAYEFLLLQEGMSRLDVLQRAVGDPDPVISRWGFDRGATLLSPDQHSLLVGSALRHAHASVRQKALRAYLASNPVDAAELLRETLLDSSRGLRALAAFELRERFAESALPIWRAALSSPSHREAQTAALALYEVGEREDVEALCERATPQNARARTALLRALERVDSGRLPQLLEAALFEESSVVLRQAALIYRRNAVSLNLAPLEEALGKASARQVPNILALSDALGRWEALEFLLRHALTEDGVRATCAAEGVNAWCGNSSKALPDVTADQAARLRKLLVAAQARHGDRNWALLELILRTQL